MADRIGQRFGDYRLTRFLGQGTFGEVYIGEHVYDKAQVAVKVLKTQLTKKNDVKSFIKEARTFRLKHPNIIQLLDFGIGDDDSPFLVMEYAPNGTLLQHHPKGTHLPLPTIATYITQIAAALQYVHDRRLLHRDVKPENMLFGPGNEIRLSDFGVAGVAHRISSLTMQEIIGTVPYMAPEQLRGQPRPASDQYALGIIVYEWLCGERPFNGNPTEIATRHCLTPPPPLREKVSTISPAVEQVVFKALEKDHQKRFASVQEFAQALAAAITPALLQKTKEEWVKEGNAQRNARRYQEAIVAYDHAIALDLNYVDAYLLRGEAYRLLKEYWRAIADHEHAISLDPTYAWTYNNRGVVYYDLKDYHKALADYTHAIQLNPNYAEAYNKRGIAYYSLKEYQQALADFDRTIALNSNYIEAYNNRGNVYLALEEYQKALANFDQAIAFNSNFALAYYNRGLVHQRRKEHKKALADFDQAIARDPQFPLAYNDRGIVYHSLKEYQKALADFDRAIIRDPKLARAYNNRGDTYRSLGNYQRALEDVDYATALDPKLGVAYATRGQIFFCLKDYKRAVEDFDRGLELNPNIPGAKAERDEAYRMLQIQREQ